MGKLDKVRYQFKKRKLKWISYKRSLGWIPFTNQSINHKENIHSKIKNKRKDWNHKITIQIIKENNLIIIGNVSPSKLSKGNLSKSIMDYSWGELKVLFEYKSKKLGRACRIINEAFYSITCSACLERTEPSGLSELVVREWTCSNCLGKHDRDTNAAKNILRFGSETPKGVSAVKRRDHGKILNNYSYI